VNKDK